MGWKYIISLIKKLLRRKSNTRVKNIEPKYIITRDRHSVSKMDINNNALTVLNTINHAGFNAYLVGGSVRDLLLHKSPKDFDVATDAKPNQIRKLFKNSRIIGRRFKLAHILYNRDIIEVATFRSSDTSHSHHQQNDRGMLVKDNVYGTLEEDAWRRDFTVNSLYYDIESGGIIDYTGGVQDVKQKIIRIIGEPNLRYQEDPVRMLRAIRFAAKLDFTIEDKTANPILQNNKLISNVSSSRLFDEMVKLYQCGYAKKAQLLLEKYQIFGFLFPYTESLKNSQYNVQELLFLALENTDSRIQQDKPVNPAFIYAVLLWFPLLNQIEILRANNIDALQAIEHAMSDIINAQNKIITIPKRYTQVMREIWMMQFRFPKRAGKRAENLLSHARFRAGYDFLALRALAGDAPMELANWWTTYQEADYTTRNKMSAQIKN